MESSLESGSPSSFNIEPSTFNIPRRPRSSRRNEIREQLVRPRHPCRQLPEPGIRRIDEHALAVVRVELPAGLRRLAGVVRGHDRLVPRVPVARVVDAALLYPALEVVRDVDLVRDV